MTERQKKKEEKFGPAKYGYDEDTPLDVYIFNESLWPECKTFTEDDYEKLWDFDNRYDYTRKSCDTETDQEDESDGESCGDYDSESNEEEEDPDKRVPKMPPKKVLRMINRSLSSPMQLNKSDMKVDDGMKSCGILISTEGEKRQRKQPGLKIRNDTLDYIVWRFYYEGQS